MDPSAASTVATIAAPIDQSNNQSAMSQAIPEFLSTGAWFTKYHKVGSFLSNHARRFLFVQSNKFFFVRHPNERPAIGNEQRVESKHQCLLSEIVNVTSGKTNGTFLSKAAQSSVKDENAFSIWIRREQSNNQTNNQSTGENIDFEATSQTERDQWVNALRAMIGQSSNQSIGQTNEKLVDVKVDVDQNGDVKVLTHPTQSTNQSINQTNNQTISIPATAGEVVKMPLDATKQARGDDSPIIVDTPTNQPNSQAMNQAIDQSINQSVHTTTIRLDDQTHWMNRIAELEGENSLLTKRIAELEQKLNEATLVQPAQSQ